MSMLAFANASDFVNVSVSHSAVLRKPNLEYVSRAYAMRSSLFRFLNGEVSFAAPRIALEEAASRWYVALIPIACCGQSSLVSP